MNTPLILKISAAILFGGLHATQAAPANRKAEPPAGTPPGTPDSISISASHNGDEGTVTYKNVKVWNGKVRKRLTAIARSIDGEDYAAAWDGKKLVWENVKGAAGKLKDKLRELEKRGRL